MTKKRSTKRARLLAKARGGDVDAQGELGWNLLSLKPIRKRQAVYWWKKAARAGLAQAQYFLGRCYDAGDGVRRERRQARIWWERAAAQGSADAELSLGLAYDRGEGGPKNRLRAYQLYRRAAAKGDEIAMHNLGVLYRYGHGVRKDARRAFQWLEKSAEFGHDDAAAAIRDLLHVYPVTSARTQVKWLLRAAQAGDVFSQVDLGVHLFDGDGVRRKHSWAEEGPTTS